MPEKGEHKMIYTSKLPHDSKNIDVPNMDFFENSFSSLLIKVELI